MLAPDAQDFGSNWAIDYYNSTDLSGPVVANELRQRLDTTFGDLPAGVNPTQFSLRATTFVNFDGVDYRFTLGADDGARLLVDGSERLDRFVSRDYTEDTVDVALADETLSVVVEFFHSGTSPRLKLSWERVENLEDDDDDDDDDDGIDDGDDSDEADTGPTAIPTATPFPVPVGQVGRGQVLNAEGLSVRSGPYLGASRLDIIEPGIEYPIFAQNTDEGMFTWYRIQVQEFIAVTDDISGEVIRQPIGEPVMGWVSGRYFVPTDVTGDIPTEGTVFETLGSPASTGVQGVLRSNMRLRQGPSYRTPTLQILDWGASVEIVGRTQQANQPHWYQVIYEGQVGWLFAPFIAVNGNLNTVPLY